MAKVLATRPTCKITSMAAMPGQIMALLEFFVCLPFRLSFQGSWIDVDEPGIECYSGIYAPLFATFACAQGMGYGYLWGGLQLVQKMLVVWLIGSTVEATNNPDPTSKVAQLWAIAVVHALQLLLLVTEMPYNERFENFVQAVVTVNQGVFFVVLAMGSDGNSENTGVVLNNLNLVAMGVTTHTPNFVHLASLPYLAPPFRRFHECLLPA